MDDFPMEDQDLFGDLPTFEDDISALVDKELTPKPEEIDLTVTAEADTIASEVVFVESRPRPASSVKFETNSYARQFERGEIVDLTNTGSVKVEQSDIAWRISNGAVIDLDSESDTPDELESEIDEPGLGESMETLMTVVQQQYQETGGQVQSPVTIDDTQVGDHTAATTEVTTTPAQIPHNLNVSSETQDAFSDQAAAFNRLARNTTRRNPSGGESDQRRAEEYVKRTLARKAGKGKKRKRSEVEAESAARLKELLAQDAASRSRPLSETTRGDLQRARHVFPPRQVRENVDDWALRGLAVKLKHHQLLGSAWMIEREKEGKACRGGILGDEMGFGKTIQSIALMLGNQCESSSPKATLVVCPPNIVHQWYDELTSRINSHPRPKILLYQSKSNYTKQEMERSFCVVTSYAMVRRSIDKAWPPDDIVTPEEISEWYALDGKFELGQLHSIKWHRVILDECTTMKNYKTITARACSFLEAKNRWLLSGTPLVNDVRELYSYMLFLKMEPGSIEQFESNFFTTEAGMQRMQHAIAGMMLRRTHTDKIFGKEVITLPDCIKEDIEFDLTPLEFAIYDVCRIRLANIINDCLRGVNQQKRLHHILEGICRLRQITAHPLLAGETIRNVLTDDDRRQIQQALMMTQGTRTFNTRVFIQQLRRQLEDASNVPAPPNTSANTNNGPFGASGMSADSFFGIIDGLKSGDAFAAEAVLKDPRLALEEECVKCGRLPEVTGFRLIPCQHIYCGRCMEDFQRDPTRVRRGQRICVACHASFLRIDEYERGMDSPLVSKKKRFIRRENQDKEWTDDADLMPSTKLMAVKAQIQSWLARDPRAKMIIFTQWLDIVRCLVQICKVENWSYGTYTGTMSLQEREETLSDFRAPHSRINVLISTLQSGGIGLNLTCATKVVNIDLYWNRGIEDQAFARVWRIGQEHQTQCVRLVARNTIDDALVDMQKEKSRRIERATNGDGSMANITEVDLLKLFGDVGYDNHNSPYIRPVRLGWHHYFGGERGAIVRTPDGRTIPKITRTYREKR